MANPIVLAVLALITILAVFLCFAKLAIFAILVTFAKFAILAIFAILTMFAMLAVFAILAIHTCNTYLLHFRGSGLSRPQDQAQRIHQKKATEKVAFYIHRGIADFAGSSHRRGNSAGSAITGSRMLIPS